MNIDIIHTKTPDMILAYFMIVEACLPKKGMLNAQQGHKQTTLSYVLVTVIKLLDGHLYIYLIEITLDLHCFNLINLYDIDLNQLMLYYDYS